MVLHPREWRLRLSDCSGTSPSRTTPVAPFQKEASANTDAASFVPVTGGSPCHSAGKCLSTKAIFNPRLKALRASALEGTLEPLAEWPLYTVSSTKAQEVRNAGVAWPVDGWLFLRAVLPPNS